MLKTFVWHGRFLPSFSPSQGSNSCPCIAHQRLILGLDNVCSSHLLSWPSYYCAALISGRSGEQRSFLDTRLIKTWTSGSFDFVLNGRRHDLSSYSLRDPPSICKRPGFQGAKHVPDMHPFRIHITGSRTRVYSYSLAALWTPPVVRS